MIVLIALIVAGCAAPSKYEKTGDARVDTLVADPKLDDATKQEILHAYHIELADKKRQAPVTGYRPVVDPSVCRGCDYERDLKQCHQMMEESTDVTSNAITGAAGGALAGALLGAMLDIDPGHTAAMGATAGGVQGVGQELQTRNAMIARCMAGRGYSVLR
ncbi:MAG: hypothetical protein JNL77_08850 [Nitrosomonas sp.]|nr:hypothetical protein [Nitrosomonas sp.]